MPPPLDHESQHEEEDGNSSDVHFQTSPLSSLQQEQAQAQELIVVVANSNNATAITINPGLSVSFLHSIFGTAVKQLSVTDLWNDSESGVVKPPPLQRRTMSVTDASTKLEIMVGADKTARGGLGVILLQATV